MREATWDPTCSLSRSNRSEGRRRSPSAASSTSGTAPILEEYIGRVEADGVAAIVIDLQRADLYGHDGASRFPRRQESSGRERSEATSGWGEGTSPADLRNHGPGSRRGQRGFRQRRSLLISVPQSLWGLGTGRPRLHSGRWSPGTGPRGRLLASRSTNSRRRSSVEKEDVPGEIVERMVQETTVAAEPALVPAKEAAGD